MKKNSIFPGILLIGIGLYFLLDELQFTLFHSFYTWPTILIIIGLAFLGQAYAGGDKGAVFPGVILTGLGIHFHALKLLTIWPDHWAMYTAIIGLAFLFKAQKTNTGGLVPGLLLLGISAVSLFYDGIISWLWWIGSIVNWIERFWPVALIVIGVYLLFFKKK